MGFAGRPQHVRVIAIGEDPTTSSVDLVEPARDAHLESLDVSAQPAPVLRLHDQMDVITLHRVVDEPRVIRPSRSGSKRPLDPNERSNTPETAHVGKNAQRDVHGVMARERRPSVVRHEFAPRPTGAFPRASSSGVGKAELFGLFSLRH